MSFDFRQTLEILTAANGVAGEETNAAAAACKLLSAYAPDARVDDFGNVVGTLPCEEADFPTLLLDAHIDEIGMIVNYITEDGFLKVSGCGGVDIRVLAAQRVTVYGNGGKNVLSGVMTSTPPHLGGDSTKALELDEIFIDIGMDGKAAKENVRLGDRALIETPLTTLAGEKLTGKALDDRSGVAVLLAVLDQLQERKTCYKIAVQFSAQEETGERGAGLGAYAVSPDYALAVDVSFALTAGEKPEKCGILGKGAMIGVSPALDRKMSDKLREVAAREGIPAQVEVMGGATGTNADAISGSKTGVRTALVSIPLKYMHTPVETISVADLENTAELIARFLCAAPVS